MITYYPKSESKTFIPKTKSIKFVPKRSDIKIVRRDIVAVPRWPINYDSLGLGYVREMLACSGTVLEDTLSYCPSHFKLGALAIISKQTVAVCEICGQSLCEEHVKRCPVCSKCGMLVCSNCVVTTGLLRKTRTCKKCTN